MNNPVIILPFILAVFANCSSKDSVEPSQDQSINFSYILDTVMVDAGDDFIYLNWNLTSSGESQDGKYLYNYNRDAISLEVIGLDKLTLEKVIPYEKEGPNGIGYGMVSRVYETSAGSLVFSDNYQISVFDKEGEKVDGLSYAAHNFEGERLPDNMRIALNETLSKDGKTMLTLYADQKLEKSPSGIAIFDLENKQFRYIPLDVFTELDKYRSNFPGGSTFAGIHLQLKSDSLLYSNTAKNEVYFYNLLTDSLTKNTYQSKYTTQEAAGNYPKRAETEKEREEVFQAKRKEVSYGRLFFDELNDVYWRFAKEMDRMKGDTVMYKTVLTAFDPNFNQLHEELLLKEFILPSKYFASNGMIYTFLNIDDELAFVRLKPKFDRD